MNELDKGALFEAWLRDGVFIEHSDGRLEILSRKEAKERIEEFINSGEYERATSVAKQLSTPIKLITRMKRKSVRVPFLTYIKLVEGALKNNISLHGYVSNLVRENLVKTVSKLKKRDDVKRDRVELLESCLSEEHKRDSGKGSYMSRSSYSPSLTYVPNNWSHIAEKIVEEVIGKRIIEAHKEVNPEILQRWLEILYPNPRPDVFAIDEMPDPEVSLKNGKLTFTFGVDLPSGPILKPMI